VPIEARLVIEHLNQKPLSALGYIEAFVRLGYICLIAFIVQRKPIHIPCYLAMIKGCICSVRVGRPELSDMYCWFNQGLREYHLSEYLVVERDAGSPLATGGRERSDSEATRQKEEKSDLGYIIFWRIELTEVLCWLTRKKDAHRSPYRELLKVRWPIRRG